ncbi:hypothetical protein VNI00_019378 [Paramarasmius palmivorus]|uniref:NAD(P)-binding protein n=1 Tax=Paramarasmius palmivorus TaxID=297713 RepID=A0AAW0ALN5_9AGAR
MAKLSILQFIRLQYKPQAPVLKADLTGQTIVVIGANTGLGYEAAKHFASMKPGRLVLGCRDRDKGDAAATRIKAETGYQAEVWDIDLSRFASVKAFVDKFEKECGRLDILVENAGMTGSPAEEYSVTEDGWVPVFQVNNIAPSLLALLLVPHMQRTAVEYGVTPRVVVVTSEAHYWADIKELSESKPGEMLKEMSSEGYHKRSDMKTRYWASKLLNVYFARSLQNHIGPSIIVTSVNPGFSITSLRRDAGVILGALSWLVERVMAFSAEVGSRQIVYGAVADKGNELKGAYISGSEVVEPSDDVVSEEGVKMGERFWDEIVEVCKELDPRVKGIVDEYLQ